MRNKNILLATIAYVLSMSGFASADTALIMVNNDMQLGGNYPSNGYDYGVLVDSDNGNNPWNVNITKDSQITNSNKGGWKISENGKVNVSGNELQIRFNNTSTGNNNDPAFGVGVFSGGEAIINSLKLDINNTRGGAGVAAGLYNLGKFDVNGSGSSYINVVGTSSNNHVANLYNSGTLNINNTNFTSSSSTANGTTGNAFGVVNSGVLKVVGKVDGTNSFMISAMRSANNMAGGLHNTANGAVNISNVNINVAGGLASGTLNAKTFASGIYNEGNMSVIGSDVNQNTFQVLSNYGGAGVLGAYNSLALNITNMNFNLSDNIAQNGYVYGIYNKGDVNRNAKITITGNANKSNIININNNIANGDNAYGISANGGQISVVNMDVISTFNIGREGYGLETRNGGVINVYSTNVMRKMLLANNTSYGMYIHDNNSRINIGGMTIQAYGHDMARVTNGGHLTFYHSVAGMRDFHNAIVSDLGSAKIDVVNNSLVVADTGALWRVSGSAMGEMNVDASTIRGYITTDAGFTRAGAVSSLSLNNASTWNMLSNSNVTNIVNNNSTINLKSPIMGSYNRLVTNNYNANNGTIMLATFIGGDDSPTDVLEINNGQALGNTMIDITTTGVGTPDIINGIKIVDAVNSTTEADAFALVGGVIDTGVYEYYLFRGDVEGVDAESWYLRHDVDSSGSGGAGGGGSGGAGGGGSGGSGGGSNITDVAKTVSNLPAAIIYVTHASMDNLTKRLGEIRETSDSCSPTGAWVKGIAKTASIYERISMDIDVYGVEAGFDRRYSLDNMTLYAGLSVGMMYVENVKVKQKNGGGNGTGSGKTPSVGAYGTLLHQNGIYADLVFRNFWHKSKMTSYSASNKAINYSSTRYMGALSLELGKRFDYASNIFLEPHIQTIYGNSPSKKFKTNFGSDVKWSKTETFIGKLALKLGYKNILSNGVLLEPYAQVAVYQEFDGKTDINFDGVKYQSDASGTTGEYTLGLNINNSNCLGLYTDITYENGKHVEALSGHVGVRYSF